MISHTAEHMWNLILTWFCVYRLIMSDKKGLLEEEGKEVEEVEEVELTKNESSSVEEEEMAEGKPAVEKSDRCELMNSVVLYQTLLLLGP